MKKIGDLLVSINILWVLFLVPSLNTTAQNLTEAQKQERCQNNKARINELETQINVVDAELSQAMEAKEIEKHRDQLVYVRKLISQMGASPSLGWDRKKVAQISANYNFNMDECLRASGTISCLSTLED